MAAPAERGRGGRTLPAQPAAPSRPRRRGTVETNARLAGPDPRASSRVFTGLNTDLEHIKTCEAGRAPLDTDLALGTVLIYSAAARASQMVDRQKATRSVGALALNP